MPGPRQERARIAALDKTNPAVAKPADDLSVSRDNDADYGVQQPLDSGWATQWSTNTCQIFFAIAAEPSEFS